MRATCKQLIGKVRPDAMGISLIKVRAQGWALGCGGWAAARVRAWCRRSNVQAHPKVSTAPESAQAPGSCARPTRPRSPRPPQAARLRASVQGMRVRSDGPQLISEMVSNYLNIDCRCVCPWWNGGGGGCNWGGESWCLLACPWPPLPPPPACHCLLFISGFVSGCAFAGGACMPRAAPSWGLVGFDWQQPHSLQAGRQAGRRGACRAARRRRGTRHDAPRP